MPYKVWAVNEILTAADMNTYVGNQTILSFAGTAARATAIGTPVEGMLSYVGGGTVEVYAGTATGWTTISGGGGGGVTIGTAAPSTPADGDLWWDSDDGKLFVYYTDATPTSQWVDAAGPSVAVQATAPTGYEGQLWLDSTDGSMYTYYTDPGGTVSSWIGAVSRSGGILQVVSTTKTDVFSTTSTSLVDITGLSASITPRSTSSKIVVNINLTAGNTTSGASTIFQLLRNGSPIATSTGGGTGNSTFVINDAGANYADVAGANFLDSPSTTSTVTYQLQMATTGGTGYAGRIGVVDRRGISTITLMEVAG